MGFLYREEQYLVWQHEHLRMWLSAAGENAVRVQANPLGKRLALPNALLDDGPGEGLIHIKAEKGVLTSGAVTVEVYASGRLRFLNTASEAVLLEQIQPYYYNPPNVQFEQRAASRFEATVRFAPQEGERFFGLGQHQHGLFDQKGAVLDLQQRNTEISIPFMVSNRRYGFLWNHPGIGRVELGQNGTRWVGSSAQQVDFVVFGGESYADILKSYAGATGYPALLPEWAAGFWQCKLRYETQEELLAVAREYKRRGLPLSVIVADFFHWSHMGEWRFDEKAWPDPAAMVRELDEMGVRLMVSIWPTITPISENFEHMKTRGYLIRNERGTDAQHVFIDHDVNGPAYFAYYDATNPDAMDFVWQTVKKNYHDIGVKLWWLDNCEPDINPWQPENLGFYLGNGLEVANLYPLLNQKAFEAGMRAAGDEDFVTLSRSGWAGSQRFQSVIWSGDIASTFQVLRDQVRAGLNMAMSGIPWWTTDIGGFHGGDIRSDEFKELIVRWFQYGVFCPITRLHGHRQPQRGPLPASGADNEVWSFGEPVYAILERLLRLRENLRPYIRAQMQITHEQGLPLMRPLLVNFPDDRRCEEIADQYLFGAQMMVAPVLQAGATGRCVYFPQGVEWIDAWSGERYAGGSEVQVQAPLERIPVFLRGGEELRGVFQVGDG
jgi:alpha-D-xyloside xylohydrolase